MEMMVLVKLLNLFLFTACVYYDVCNASGASTIKHRKDVALRRSVKIAGKTVTCSGGVTGSDYPLPMYTCMDIRVDGNKIHYSTTQFPTLSLRQRICPNNDKQQPTNIQSLCSALLHANNITQYVAAAYVPKPTCTPEANTALYKFLRLNSGADGWELATNTTNGHINTIQCLTEVS